MALDFVAAGHRDGLELETKRSEAAGQLPGREKYPARASHLRDQKQERGKFALRPNLASGHRGKADRRVPGPGFPRFFSGETLGADLDRFGNAAGPSGHQSRNIQAWYPNRRPFFQDSGRRTGKWPTSSTFPRNVLFAGFMGGSFRRAFIAKDKRTWTGAICGREERDVSLPLRGRGSEGRSLAGGETFLRRGGRAVRVSAGREGGPPGGS